MIEIKDNYENYSVAKRNDLITNRGPELSLNSQKLLLILASTIQPHDSSFFKQTFKIVHLAKILGVTPQALYQELPKLTESLMLTLVTIPDDKGGFERVHLLAYYKYEAGMGEVTLGFHEAMAPFYLKLQSNFTRYKLKNVLTLNSKYSIRFYELFRCYLNEETGAGTYTCNLHELKELIGATQKSYNTYGNFKLKVLEPAKEEINKTTDLEVKYKENKVGRKVEGITFKIKLKKPSTSKKLNAGDSPTLPPRTNEILDAIETLDKIITEIKTLTTKEISRADAQYLLICSKELNKEIEEAYDFLSINTENPVGAILDYFKNPDKYKTKKKVKRKVIRQESVPDWLTPGYTPPASEMTEEEAKAAIERMKQLQESMKNFEKNQGKQMDLFQGYSVIEKNNKKD